MSDANFLIGDFDDELQNLVEAYCAGSLSAAEQERLNAQLAEDPIALERFVAYVEFHARLRRWAVRASQAKTMAVALGQGGPMAPGELQTQAIPPSSFEPSDSDWPANSQSPKLGAWGDLFTNTFSLLSAPLVLFLVAGAFVAGGATGIWWLGRRAAEAPNRVAMAEPRVAPVAYLTLANGCDWGKNSAQVQFVGSAVNPGDELTLQEGIAEFRLLCGVSLSVEGPASLVMASPNSLILQEGKLTANVPWKAADFQILAGTNRLAAADAEFGVQAKGSSVSIHVFSGEVTATLSPYSVNERTTVFNDGFVGDEDLRPSLIKIEQSEAVELTSNSDRSTAVRRFTADQGQFASRTSMAWQLPITPRYVDAVKQSKPVAYWRFETVENHEIRNEIPASCPLKVTTEIYLPGDEANHVLESGYAFDRDNLVSTEPMDRFFNGDFSVELWIKPSHFHRGMFVSVMDKSYSEVEIDRAEFERQSAKFGYGFALGTSPDFGVRPGTVRGSVMNPSQRANADNCASENNLYKLRRWQHVVVVRANGVMRLYFDGQQVALAKSRHKATLVEGQRLTVGRLLPSWDGYAFVGQLDELSVYDRALPPEEIKEHFDAVNVQAVELKRPSKSRGTRPATNATRRVNDS